MNPGQFQYDIMTLPKRNAVIIKNRGVRRYKFVPIETAYNVRVGPVWGVAGLVGVVSGPVGAAAPVGPAVLN